MRFIPLCRVTSGGQILKCSRHFYNQIKETKLNGQHLNAKFSCNQVTIFVSLNGILRVS